MNKRIFVAALAAMLVIASGCTTSGPGTGDPAARRKAIDASVDSSLSTLYQQVPDSRDLVGRAAGVLVFPNVVEAGFVVGASRGQGALRVGGKTVSYHATTSGSLRPAGGRAVHGRVRAVHDAGRAAALPERAAAGPWARMPRSR